MPDNSDLTDDYWALRKALDYASEEFAYAPERAGHDDTGDDETDDMLSRAWEALDAIKSRLQL